MTPWYATREEIKAELDARETARSNARIDRALTDATEAVEGLTHRRFYPQVDTRSWDWPTRQSAPSWRLWLDGDELISVTSVTSGGVLLDPAGYFLRRSDSRNEPPYSHLELDTAAGGAFGGGPTTQRSVSITGVYGYRNDETPLGVTVQALDTSTTGIDVDAVTSAQAGVGSLLRIGSERAIVTGRSQLDTGQTVAGTGLTIQNNDTALTVADGTAFAAGEAILVDSERLLVEEVAGNVLIVKRAWDGSNLAAHTVGATIWAPRTLTVSRGALGTTAAEHTLSAPVYLWRPPGTVRQLCVAEAVTDLLQGRSGYARTAGSGDNEREASGRALADLRHRAETTHGRTARTGAI